MELVGDDRGGRETGHLHDLNCLRRVRSRLQVSRFSNAARRGIDESAATSAHYTINEPINELGRRYYESPSDPRIFAQLIVCTSRRIICRTNFFSRERVFSFSLISFEYEFLASD